MMIVISGFQNAINRETKDNLDTKIKCNQEEYKNHSLLYSEQLLWTLLCFCEYILEISEYHLYSLSVKFPIDV